METLGKGQANLKLNTGVVEKMLIQFIRDEVRNAGFSKGVVGVSGGVDSALVMLEVRPRPAVDIDDMDGFFRFVEALFQFRRKQLGGTLGRIAGSSGVEAAARLDELGIEPVRRPQTLTLPEWEAVYRAFNRGFDR